MATSTFNSKSTALEVVQGLNTNLNGKIVLITGATSGVGLEAARALAQAHAHVIITTRDMNKGTEVAEEMKRTTGNQTVEAMEMELHSLQSVRNFVALFRQRQLPIHILVCNAAVTACPYTKTIDGFESQFAVNHLAHFLLTTSLLPELRAGKPSRVIVISSLANKRGDINWNDINWETNYEKWAAFAQSKTANILFAKQFNQFYEHEGIRAYSLQPGGILTNLKQQMPEKQQRAMGWYREDGTLIDVFKTMQQGAATIVYAALAPELDNHGGEYLEDCAISKGVNPDKTAWGIASYAADEQAAERLWKLSEQMLSNEQIDHS